MVCAPPPPPSDTDEHEEGELLGKRSREDPGAGMVAPPPSDNEAEGGAGGRKRGSLFPADRIRAALQQGGYATQVLTLLLQNACARVRWHSAVSCSERLSTGSVGTPLAVGFLRTAASCRAPAPGPSPVRPVSVPRNSFNEFSHPGGNPGANLKSISHRCYLFEVAFASELTK